MMKYKDLYIGDWFTYKDKPFIKTFCPDLGSHYDFCLAPSSSYFGILFQTLPDESEVNLLPRLNVYNPYPLKGTTTFTLTQAPLCQFLSWQSNGEEIIFIKAFIQRQDYLLALNGERFEIGMWEKSPTDVLVKIIPRIYLKYQEKLDKLAVM